VGKTNVLYNHCILVGCGEYPSPIFIYLHFAPPQFTVPITMALQDQETEKLKSNVVGWWLVYVQWWVWDSYIWSKLEQIDENRIILL